MTDRMMPVLYNDSIMPDETKKIRHEIREFVDSELEPIAHELSMTEETKDSFPHEIFRKMAERGLFGIPFPKEYGGKGLEYPISAASVVEEELAYASNSIAVLYDTQCMLAGNALLHGSNYLRDKYLKPLIKGELIGSFATTEPDASTDLSVDTVETIAEKKGNKYLINGTKRFISNAPAADFVIALCRNGDALTEFVIDLKSDGVTIGNVDNKIGNKGQITADIIFENVSVSKENIIGTVDKGLRNALATLYYGRIAISATGVGMAQRAFDETVHYLKKREAFGQKIGQFQYWQFKIAEWIVAIENARNISYKAAKRRDSGVEYPEPETAIAKYYSTKIAVDIARDAVQAFGGYGYLNKLGSDESFYKVSEIFKDSKVTEIYEGTNEVQKMIIAKKVFGKNF